MGGLNVIKTRAPINPSYGGVSHTPPSHLGPTYTLTLDRFDLTPSESPRFPIKREKPTYTHLNEASDNLLPRQ